MLNTILVPLDGSPLAETALEPAMLLARALRSRSDVGAHAVPRRTAGGFTALCRDT